MEQRDWSSFTSDPLLHRSLRFLIQVDFECYFTKYKYSSINAKAKKKKKVLK